MASIFAWKINFTHNTINGLIPLESGLFYKKGPERFFTLLEVMCLI
jgi:hypothetical protein